MEITKMFEFEAAHRLINTDISDQQNKKIYGKCYGTGINEELCHGHSYKLQVTLSGERDSNGMIVNFHDLKGIVNKLLISKVDHKFLNEVSFLKGKPTTCEVMVEQLWIILDSYLAENKSNFFLKKLQLWETADSSAILEISETNRAWLAALIDGEGTITINQSSDIHKRMRTKHFRYYGRISISNTSKLLIDEIMHRFPYFILRDNKKQKKKGFKLCYSLGSFSKPNMKRILLYIYPYLIIKKDRAKILIDCCNRNECSSDILKESYKKVNALNKKGD